MKGIADGLLGADESEWIDRPHRPRPGIAWPLQGRDLSLSRVAKLPGKDGQVSGWIQNFFQSRVNGFAGGGQFILPEKYQTLTLFDFR